MPTPVIGTVQAVNSAGSNTNALTTSSKTVATGDVFVGIGVTEDAAVTPGVFSDSSTRITWTQYKTLSTASNCGVRLSYGVVASTGTTTITSAALGSARQHSMTLWQVTGGSFAATPAFISSTAGGTAPSVNITTTSANSLVIVGHGDWSANAPGTPAYRSGGVQDGIHDVSTAIYVAYYYHAAVASASTVAMGQTAPTGQTPAMLAIEVKDAGGAAAPIINLTMAPITGY